MYVRIAKPVSGGPTKPVAWGTPGMMWHDPQLYSRVSALP